MITSFPPAAATVNGQYFSHYSVTLNPGWPDITNIMMFEAFGNSGSTTWALPVSGSDPFSSNTTELHNPFPFSEPPLTSFLIGIATGFSTDASPDQEHVVLMMDPFAASLTAGIAWDTIFPATLEESLIAAIGLDAVCAFVNEDAKQSLDLEASSTPAISQQKVLSAEWRFPRGRFPAPGSAR